MASADEYANWIVANADKKGTPEFDTVSKAYQEAKAESPKAYDINPSLASAMNVGQALTFGFGDEIAGKVGDAFPSLGLDKNRYRATVDKFRQEYPGAAALGSVSGSLLLPGGAAKLAKFNPWATAATVGGVTGMVQGAGDAEDGNTLEGATRQGAMGMALGPLALGSMKVTGMTAGALGNQVASHFPVAGQKYSEWLARNRVADAFSRDNVTADDVLRKMADLGPEARIGDAAGESTRGLLDLNANLPGKTKDGLEGLIRNRIATRPDRMDDAVYAVNGGYGRAGDLSAALEKQKLAEAAPLYQQLHSMSVAVSPNLKSIFDAATKLGATGTAKKIATAERQPFTLGSKEADNALMLASSSQKVSMRDADLVKRGIDTLIERETDAVTGKVSTLGRSYVRLKNDLLGDLDGLTTDQQTGVSLYKSARDAFAGPASLQTAIKKGRSFWNDDAESLGLAMDGMSNSEREAFRVGASEALRQKIGSQPGQTQLLNFWKDRNTREKLKAVIGDDAKYSDVEKMLRGEETLKRMESLGPSRNSRTFSREAGAEQQTLDNASDLVAAGLNAKTGGLASMIAGLGKYSARVGTPEPVRDSIGSILMSKYATDEMNALRLAQEAIKARKAASGAASGVAGGKMGGLLDF